MAKANDNMRIEFDYEGKHYILEFTPSSIKKMESQLGVSFANFSDKVFTNSEKLFEGAFLEHHPTVSKKKIAEIRKALELTADGEEPDENDDGEVVSSLNRILIEMIGKTMEEINNVGGNVKWTVTR